jgi:tRNA(His) guanylyltransferase
MQDSLNDRMKDNYENRYRFYLTRRTPVIIRLDGVAFHTLTRRFEKPFSVPFRHAMMLTTMYLVREIQGAVAGYCQSDEISILLIDYKRLNTEAWFDYNINKINSVAASMASVQFNKNLLSLPPVGLTAVPVGYFDSRAFNLPREEVTNYFIGRQKDWMRNSVTMYALSFYSQEQLHKKDCETVKKMIVADGHPAWESLEDKWRNGIFVFENDQASIVLKEQRDVIENLLLPEEE